MNALSLRIYYRRHMGRAALLLAISMLVTTGLYLLVALVWAAFIEPGRSNFMFLSKFNLISPTPHSGGLDPAVIAQVRDNPDVANVIPTATIWITVPGVMGDSNGFYLLGVRETDLPVILEKSEAVLAEGKLLEPRTNGLLISKNVAASLGLLLGSTIQESTDSDRYTNIIAPLEVVGILQSDLRLGIVSLEYLDNHEYYSKFLDSFLVVAKENREASVEKFLLDDVESLQVDVRTYQQLKDIMLSEYLESLLVLAPVFVIISVAFLLVIAVINWFEFAQRLPELGVLNALGYHKQWLIHRLASETAGLVIGGWILGIVLSLAILFLLKILIFTPRGYDLAITVFISALAITVPLPALVIMYALISTQKILSGLDPVAIVEKGNLNLESAQKRYKAVYRSSSKPFAPSNYYLRHKRQAIIHVGAMSLMIFATVSTVFLLAVAYDAKEPGIGYLRKISRVSTPSISQGVGIVSQLKLNPSIERVIPIAPRYHMLGVSIPPFIEAEASPFGVYADDLAYLVELYDLKLQEGHLPQPYTNDMVIPAALAKNRDLRVGDVIGDPEKPAYPNAPTLPTEFIVSGIFESSTLEEDENWLGFVSLEYMQSHEYLQISETSNFMIVPKAGQKEFVDNWLEQDLAVDGIWVMTYLQEKIQTQKDYHNQVLILAILESLIVFVAACTLAVLNHIFTSQRQSEFGVLLAIGYDRLYLIRRIMKETIFTTGSAWLLSATLCVIAMLYLRTVVYAPLGLGFNFLKPTPWLFTLPIPFVVLVVTTGTIARLLFRLDLVTMLERR